MSNYFRSLPTLEYPYEGKLVEGVSSTIKATDIMVRYKF